MTERHTKRQQRTSVIFNRPLWLEIFRLENRWRALTLTDRKRRSLSRLRAIRYPAAAAKVTVWPDAYSLFSMKAVLCALRAIQADGSTGAQNQLQLSKPARRDYNSLMIQNQNHAVKEGSSGFEHHWSATFTEISTMGVWGARLSGLFWLNKRQIHTHTDSSRNTKVTARLMLLSPNQDALWRRIRHPFVGIREH
jgi:hypothetical protein